MGSYHFDPAGREQYSKVMQDSGYVEIIQFEPHMDGYSCASCEYFRKAQTPTGFTCIKWKFPDRPQGCCDFWEPTPGLIDNGNSGKET